MYQTIEDLAVDVNNAVLVTTTLGELRSALKYERLGKYVLNRIVQELEGHNLGYFPRKVLEDNLEPRQNEEVRVYKRNSDAGKYIRAVTHPNPAGDHLLINATGSSDAETTLDKVRALVCQ